MMFGEQGFVKMRKPRVVIVSSASGVDFAYASRFDTILIQPRRPGLLFLFFGQEAPHSTSYQSGEHTSPS